MNGVGPEDFELQSEDSRSDESRDPNFARPEVAEKKARNHGFKNLNNQNENAVSSRNRMCRKRKSPKLSSAETEQKQKTKFGRNSESLSKPSIHSHSQRSRKSIGARVSPMAKNHNTSLSVEDSSLNDLPSRSQQKLSEKTEPRDFEFSESDEGDYPYDSISVKRAKKRMNKEPHDVPPVSVSPSSMAPSTTVKRRSRRLINSKDKKTTMTSLSSISTPITQGKQSKIKAQKKKSSSSLSRRSKVDPKIKKNNVVILSSSSETDVRDGSIRRLSQSSPKSNLNKLMEVDNENAFGVGDSVEDKVNPENSYPPSYVKVTQELSPEKNTKDKMPNAKHQIESQNETTKCKEASACFPRFLQGTSHEYFPPEIMKKIASTLRSKNERRKSKQKKPPINIWTSIPNQNESGAIPPKIIIHLDGAIEVVDRGKIEVELWKQQLEVWYNMAQLSKGLKFGIAMDVKFTVKTSNKVLGLYLIELNEFYKSRGGCEEGVWINKVTDKSPLYEKLENLITHGGVLLTVDGNKVKSIFDVVKAWEACKKGPKEEMEIKIRLRRS